MSIIADIFVASASEALGYAQADLAQDRATTAAWPHKSFKGLTDLEFSLLWAILDGVDPDSPEYEDGAYDLEHVPTPGLEEDTQLCRLPPAFATYLVAMDTAAQGNAAAIWAETEELDCQPADLLPVIRDLQALAQTAQNAGKDLYFWSIL